MNCFPNSEGHTEILLHSAMGETANLMMFGRELRLPDQLQGYPPPVKSELSHDEFLKTKERLRIRQDDQKEPLLFAVGDMVWLENR